MCGFCFNLVGHLLWSMSLVLDLLLFPAMMTMCFWWLHIIFSSSSGWRLPSAFFFSLIPVCPHNIIVWGGDHVTSTSHRSPLDIYPSYIRKQLCYGQQIYMVCVCLICSHHQSGVTSNAIMWSSTQNVSVFIYSPVLSIDCVEGLYTCYSCHATQPFSYAVKNKLGTDASSEVCAPQHHLHRLWKVAVPLCYMHMPGVRKHWRQSVASIFLSGLSLDVKI